MLVLGFGVIALVVQALGKYMIIRYLGQASLMNSSEHTEIPADLRDACDVKVRNLSSKWPSR